MGRYTGTPPVTPSLTNQGPIGGIVSMIRSGTDYKAIGEVISRTAFAAFSALFPRIGSFLAAATTATSTNKWVAMAYGNGVFVAVGTTSADAATNQATYSRDGGKTWALSTLPASVVWRNIIWDGAKFVAVGPTTCVTSPDGITWTTKTASASGRKGIAYNGSLYVMADTGTTGYSSPDLVTWTNRTMPTSSTWTDIAYGNGIFIATTGGTAAATSADGVTWTARTMPAGTWGLVVFAAGLFVAQNQGTGSPFATSPDGITWTARSAPPDFGTTGSHGLAYGNGVFYAASLSANRAAISYDGITWVEKTITVPAISAPYVALAYGNGVFATIYGTAGQVAYAENLTDSDLMYLSGTAGQYVRVK